MSGEIGIEFVDGHADVWRLHLVGIATVVTELTPEAAAGLGRLHALVRL